MKPDNSRLLGTIVLISLLIGMTACKAADDPQSPESTDPEPAEQAEVPEVKMPMNLNGQIQFSISDLAKRLDVPPDSIKVSGARAVTWRSGALGCPEPGMNYTQALVPGSVIYLQVENVTHAYHAKIAGTPFYCPRERVESPVAEGDGDPT